MITNVFNEDIAYFKLLGGNRYGDKDYGAEEELKDCYVEKEIIEYRADTQAVDVNTMLFIFSREINTDIDEDDKVIYENKEYRVVEKYRYDHLSGVDNSGYVKIACIRM